MKNKYFEEEPPSEYEILANASKVSGEFNENTKQEEDEEDNTGYGVYKIINGKWIKTKSF